MNVITTITGREFDQDTGRAKRAAKAGPVVITDRGRPAHVLLTIEDYERLIGDIERAPASNTPTRPRNLLEALAQPGGPEYDFDVELPPRVVEREREIDFGLD